MGIQRNAGQQVHVSTIKVGAPLNLPPVVISHQGGVDSMVKLTQSAFKHLGDSHGRMGKSLPIHTDDGGIDLEISGSTVTDGKTHDAWSYTPHFKTTDDLNAFAAELAKIRDGILADMNQPKSAATAGGR